MIAVVLAPTDVVFTVNVTDFAPAGIVTLVGGTAAG